MNIEKVIAFLKAKQSLIDVIPSMENDIDTIMMFLSEVIENEDDYKIIVQALTER